MGRCAGEAIAEYVLRPQGGLPHPARELTIERSTIL